MSECNHSIAWHLTINWKLIDLLDTSIEWLQGILLIFPYQMNDLQLEKMLSYGIKCGRSSYWTIDNAKGYCIKNVVKCVIQFGLYYMDTKS